MLGAHEQNQTLQATEKEKLLGGKLQTKYWKLINTMLTQSTNGVFQHQFVLKLEAPLVKLIM